MLGKLVVVPAQRQREPGHWLRITDSHRAVHAEDDLAALQ